MYGNTKPAQINRAKRFTRAAESLRLFFRRVLTPVHRPFTSLQEAPELPQDDRILKKRRPSFQRELFAELLIELPMHRRRLSAAHENGDMNTLGNAVHQLLGAVAYCEAPELEAALRELQLALKTREQHSIDIYHERAINVLDSILVYSGYRSYG